MQYNKALATQAILVSKISLLVLSWDLLTVKKHCHTLKASLICKHCSKHSTSTSNNAGSCYILKKQTRVIKLNTSVPLSFRDTVPAEHKDSMKCSWR